MYNLIEYSSNKSEKTRRLWSYQKIKQQILIIIFENTDEFKYFGYNIQLIANTKAQHNLNHINGFLKNTKIAKLLCHKNTYVISGDYLKYQ